MPDSIGPGKRKKISSTETERRRRSKTLAGVSQNAVDQLLTRRQTKPETSLPDVGACGALAEDSEDDVQSKGSDVEWEDEEMYVRSASGNFEIDFLANSKRKSRGGNRVTKEEKQFQKDVQHSYLLCTFARGLVLDRVCDNPLLQSLMLSMFPMELCDGLASNYGGSSKVVFDWFTDKFRVEKVKRSLHMEKEVCWLEKYVFYSVIGAFQRREGNDEELMVMFISLMRALGFEARIVQVLEYIEMKKPTDSKNKKKLSKEALDVMEVDSPTVKERLCWCEIWANSLRHATWVHIDPLNGVPGLYFILCMFDLVSTWFVGSPEAIETRMENEFIGHVVGFYGGGAQDVGPRYMSNIHRVQAARKDPWWTKLLDPYRQIMSKALGPILDKKKGRAKKSKMEKEEEEFEKLISKREKIPPNTVDGFKKSSHYILERHITKFKGLVPDARVMGEHRGEAYYLRSDVEELHSVVKWPHQGRVVKEEEIPRPHKIVKKRAKPKKPNDEVVPTTEETEEKTELYGYWQTEPWKRPVAKNGIVPRNSYGNVEIPPLVKALPENTTYMLLPNLAPICKKLGVDFAPALVGFELVKGGRQVPRTNGIVICTEHVEKVTEAFLERERQREEALEKERQQYAKDGWKALLTAVHANLKLHLRYTKPQKQ